MTGFDAETVEKPQTNDKTKTNLSEEMYISNDEFESISGAWTTTALEIPNFDKSNAYAVSAKAAGRLNASVVKEEEVEALLTERKLLLDKKLSGEISRREDDRLEYVRWSLERIEDARNGADLDELEGQLGVYENFLNEMNIFYEHLNQRATSGTRHKSK